MNPTPRSSAYALRTTAGHGRTEPGHRISTPSRSGPSIRFAVHDGPRDGWLAVRADVRLRCERVAPRPGTADESARLPKAMWGPASEAAGLRRREPCFIMILVGESSDVNSGWMVVALRAIAKSNPVASRRCPDRHRLRSAQFRRSPADLQGALTQGGSAPREVAGDREVYPKMLSSTRLQVLSGYAFRVRSVSPRGWNLRLPPVAFHRSGYGQLGTSPQPGQHRRGSRAFPISIHERLCGRIAGFGNRSRSLGNRLDGRRPLNDGRDRAIPRSLLERIDGQQDLLLSHMG